MDALVSIQLISPTRGDRTRNFKERTFLNGVSIQLISPTRGDPRENNLHAISVSSVSIQLISPTRGDSTFIGYPVESNREFPFN